MAFIDVYVEPHEALPDGCSMRFKSHGEARTITRVRYESEDGVEGTWTIAAGGGAPARAMPVEDSSAGSSTLVVGDAQGLRLTHEATGETIAEAYLLVRDDAVL
jgi:hypothetical protein